MAPGIGIAESSVVQVDRCKNRMGSEDQHTAPTMAEVQVSWMIAKEVTLPMTSTPDQCPTAGPGGRHGA